MKFITRRESIFLIALAFVMMMAQATPAQRPNRANAQRQNTDRPNRQRPRLQASLTSNST
jgi:hypothetical protein